MPQHHAGSALGLGILAGRHVDRPSFVALTGVGLVWWGARGWLRRGRRGAPLALLFGCVALCQPGARAQPARDGSVDADLGERADALMAAYDRPDSPGAAIALVQDGRLVLARGYGSAQLEYGQPITPRTPFHVASVSKQFTAFGLVLLAERGELSLDDDVRAHLPWVPDFGRPITLRQLMHHTSGLRDQWTLLHMAGWRFDDVITQQQVLTLVRRQRELNFAPGSEFTYCNTGYTLLAEVISASTERSFAQWMEAEVFTPLGMGDTHVHIDHEQLIPGRAYSYRRQGEGGFKKAVLSFSNFGATSLFTTAEDLGRWLVHFGTHELGGPEAFEEQCAPAVLDDGTLLDYASGLFVERYRGLRRVGHRGGDAGFRAYVGYFPDQRVGVAVLANLSDFDTEGVGMQLAELLLDGDLLDEAAPAAPSPGDAVVDASAEALQAWVGEYYIPAADARRSIALREGRLVYERDGRGSSPLALREDGELLMEDVADEWVLVRRAGGGSPGRLRWVRNGRADSYVHPWEPPAADLCELVGTYESPELQTRYSLTLENGRLLARHPRHVGFELLPRSLDRFRGTSRDFEQVRAERDASGAVTGLRVSSERVRELLFEKLDLRLMRRGTSRDSARTPP